MQVPSPQASSFATPKALRGHELESMFDSGRKRQRGDCKIKHQANGKKQYERGKGGKGYEFVESLSAGDIGNVHREHFEMLGIVRKFLEEPDGICPSEEVLTANGLSALRRVRVYAAEKGEVPWGVMTLMRWDALWRAHAGVQAYQGLLEVDESRPLSVGNELEALRGLKLACR